MDKLEKVEKLVEKTGVSYEEAKTALEANNEDLLDAIVYLEKSGKVKSPEVQSFVTNAQEQPYSEEFNQAQAEYAKDSKKKTFGSAVDRFIAFCKRLLKKGMENQFVVTKENKTVLDIPVLLFVIGLLCFWEIIIILLIVGLFCGMRYRFLGTGKVNDDINQFCDKASQTAENLKSDFQEK